MQIKVWRPIAGGYLELCCFEGQHVFINSPAQIIVPTFRKVREIACNPILQKITTIIYLIFIAQLYNTTNVCETIVIDTHRKR